MDTQTMLDNIAAASQCHSFLDRVTRGAVLRSIHQWIVEHPKNDAFYHDCFTNDLEADPDFSR